MGAMKPVDHHSYRVRWSLEDGEYVGTCDEFASLSWLGQTPQAALAGIRRVVAEAVADLRASGENAPSLTLEQRLALFDPVRHGSEA